MDNGIVYRSISDLGFDMRTERNKKRLTQYDVAKYCGASSISYARWENGVTKKINEKSFLKLKELFS